MATPTTPETQALVDKQALYEVVARYCRSVDRRDFALTASVYHDDAFEDRGAIYTGSAIGFIDLIKRDSANYAATMHRIFNSYFVVDGNRAEGEIYVEAYHRTTGDNSQEIIASGRFLDCYEKRDNRWAIVKRTATVDACEMRPVDMTVFSQFVAGSIAGRPSRDDASYKVLPLLAQLTGK